MNVVFNVKTLKIVENLRRSSRCKMLKEVLRHHSIVQNSMAQMSTSCGDSYEEAVKALNSLQTNAAVLQQAKKRIGQPNTNVAETRKFLARSGVSQESLDSCLSVIHVAGTKGKGSTCAFTESILRQHGFRTGFYSSPHLVAVRERIRIDGEPLSKEAFTRYFWEVFHKLSALREHDHDMPPYFKFLTVMAFNVFLKERVDVAIVEVGIGGELDCTNVIRKPVTVGITSLGLDHTSLLGNTVELIARQKAGIMKSQAPAFTVLSQPGQSLSVLRNKAMEVGCSLTVSPALTKYSWPLNEPAGPVLGLDSQVQQLNASLAVQLSHAWLRHHNTGVTDGSTVLALDTATAQGLRLARWPGRAQILPHSPNIRFFLDGAHTVDSIENCQQWFLQASQQQRTKKPVKRVLIFNSTGERDPSTLLKPLCDSNAFQYVAFCPNLASNQITSDQSNFMVTREQQLERATLHAETWSQLQCPELGTPEVPCQVFSSVADTLDWLYSLQDSKHTLHVLITGSLHLVGCALGLLEPPTETQTIISDEQNHQRIAALPLVGTVH